MTVAAWVFALAVGGTVVPSLFEPARAATAGGTPAAVLTWSAAHPSTSPPALSGASAAYDGDTSTVVLFGGVGTGGAMSDDTWVWDGRSWTDLPASETHPPAARQGASMAFDPTLHRLILFGGQAADGTLLGDTWAWNGQSWTELAAGGLEGITPSPPPREGAAMSFDPTGNLVLYGGTGYAAGSAPVQAPASTTTTTTTPTAGTSRAAATSGGSSGGSGSTGGSTSTGGTASTGGSGGSSGSVTRQVLGDTWQWTDAGWFRDNVAGPPPLSGAAMTYDTTSLTSVLFGGETTVPGTSPAKVYAGTWTWNGSGWTQSHTSTSPPARYSAVLADSPGLGGVVLIGGQGSAGALADGWLWTPAGWSSTLVTGTDVARAAAASAVAAPTMPDPSSGLILIYGGIGADGQALGDTEIVAATRPAPTNPGGAATTTTLAGAGGVTPTTAAPTRPGGGQPGPPSTPSTIRSRTAPTTAAATHPMTPSTARSGNAGSGSRNSSATGAGLSITTSARTVHQGSTVRVAGSGFAPGSSIEITFHSTPELVGRAIADATGSFSAYVSVPDSARPGAHRFMATGTTSAGHPASLVAQVMVLPPAGGSGTSNLAKAFLFGLAVLVPVATWAAMAAAGRWRRRSITRPGTT